MARNVWQDIQHQEQRKEAHRQNAARRASLAVTYETTGAGELVPAQPVRFEQPFLHEPSVTSGLTIVRVPDRRYYRLPQVTVGVLRWERNSRGFFLGAFMYYRVDCDLLPDVFIEVAPPNPVLYHHFVFAGQAYKAMSSEINQTMIDESVRPLVPPTVP